MELLPVESSNIAKVGYDEPTKTLGIQFHSGKTYTYRPVTQALYNKLINAPSIGGYFIQHIKNNKEIDYEQID